MLDHLSYRDITSYLRALRIRLRAVDDAIAALDRLQRPDHRTKRVRPAMGRRHSRYCSLMRAT